MPSPHLMSLLACKSPSCTPCLALPRFSSRVLRLTSLVAPAPAEDVRKAVHQMAGAHYTPGNVSVHFNGLHASHGFYSPFAAVS